MNALLTRFPSIQKLKLIGLRNLIIIDLDQQKDIQWIEIEYPNTEVFEPETSDDEDLDWEYEIRHADHLQIIFNPDVRQINMVSYTLEALEKNEFTSHNILRLMRL